MGCLIRQPIFDEDNVLITLHHYLHYGISAGTF